MDLIKPFSSFLTRVILPNTTGYLNWINQDNIERRLESIREEYKKSFNDLDPFILDNNNVEKTIRSIQTNLQRKSGTSFERFNHAAANGIPNTLLNTYLVEFISIYEPIISFNDFQELINKVNEKLGQPFCINFQKTRRDFNGKSKISSTSKLFGDVREEYWTINIGAEREIQYHINLSDSMIITYGLGFNSQTSRSNLNPMLNVKPFIDSYFANRVRIKSILNDYKFTYGTEKDLKEMVVDKFISFGKTLPVTKDPSNRSKYKIEGLNFIELLYDLKGKQFDAYKIIFSQSKNASIMNISNQRIIDLLRYKKQIIIQGPPGTGKTKLAKELASSLIGTQQIDSKDNHLTDNDIIQLLTGVATVKTVAGESEYEIVFINPETKKVRLKKKTNTEGDTSFNEIKEFYYNSRWLDPTENNDDRRAAALAGLIAGKKKSIITVKESDQFKLIQFHPSYSYEDFVRGITAKPNENGEGIFYKAENKILGKLAYSAKKNYDDSQKEEEELTKEIKLRNKLDAFIDEVRESLDKTGEYSLGNETKAKIVGFAKDDSGFIYSFEERKEIRYTLLFSDIFKIHEEPKEILKSTDVRDIDSLVMKGKYPYYFRVYNLIKNQSESKQDAVKKVTLKNFVLVIDEINRANLSSVLGELIYSIEYRGEKSEGMYEVEGSNEFVLPPNLYIIGTMNTADRSVGHIDYAIRRRFAFVDLIPKDLTGEEDVIFDKILFDKVSALFEKNLSSEFERKDVALGHSYFIDKTQDGGTMDVRLQYEIKPILLEYIKDGILTGKVNNETPIKDYVINLQVD